MERVTKPRRPAERAHIFTEGINYFETDEDSIWGRGDRATLKFLGSAKIRGAWLNIAAGDGRYNLELLRRADSVVASDIDRSALSKLFHYTPARYKNRLKVKVFNVVKRFPFKDDTFDGVFCTGVLHLFPRPVFARIVREIDRVLKPGGMVILDFAADIVRTSPDGKMVTFGHEPKYTLKEAERILTDSFKSYRIRMVKSSVDDSKEGLPPYRFQCNFILLSAIKS